MKKKVTIIGYGTMGRAIAGALKKNAPKISVSGIDISDSKKRAANSDYIVLSVKPQDASCAIDELKSAGIGAKTVLVSIMAGFPIRKIVQLSGHKKIVRVMPNLGLSVGAGIAGWTSSGLSGAEKKEAKKFLDKISENFEVKGEDTLNKITAVSGSGPAYFFLFAKYLEDSARKLGFKKGEARKLVEKTFSASSLLSKDAGYSELVKKVASKGGTTEAALKVFAERKLDKMVGKAVRTAYKRAKELGK